MVLRLFSLLAAVMIAAPAAAELYPYEDVSVNGPNNILDATADACSLAEGCYTQTGGLCSANPGETCLLQRVPKGRCANGTQNVWPVGAGTCVGNPNVACLADPPNQSATSGNHSSVMCDDDTTGSGLCDMSSNTNNICTSEVTGANNEIAVCGGGADANLARCSDGDPNASNGGFGTALCAQINSVLGTTQTNCGPISKGITFSTPVYQIENPPLVADLQRDPGNGGNSGPIIEARVTVAREWSDPDAFGVRRGQGFGRSYFNDWTFSDGVVNGSGLNSMIIVYQCDPPVGYRRNLPVTGACTAPAANIGNFCITDAECDDVGGDGVCGGTEFCYEASQSRDQFALQWTRDLTVPEQTGVCPPDCAIDLDHHTYETEEIVRLGLIDTPTGVQVAFESGEGLGQRSAEGDHMGVVPVTAVTWLGSPDLRCVIEESSPGSGNFLGRCSGGVTRCDLTGVDPCPGLTEGECLPCNPDPFFDDQGLGELTQIGRPAGVEPGSTPALTFQAAVITPLFAIGSTGRIASEFRDDTTGGFDINNMGPATVPNPFGDPPPSPGINLETGTVGYTVGDPLPFGGTAGATTTVNPENGGIVTVGQTFLRGWDQGPGADGIMGCFGDNAGANDAANACDALLSETGPPGNSGTDDFQITADLGSGAVPVALNRFKVRPPNFVVRKHFLDGGLATGEAATASTVANWTIRDLDFPALGAFDGIDVVVKTSTTTCPIVDRPDTGTTEAYCSCDKTDPAGDCDTDGVMNKADNCPFWSTSNVTDTNADGIGDECQCGDTTGDGGINLLDIFGVNDMILGAIPTTDLCDTNLDSSCNLLDIFGVNDKILGTPAYCIRFPESSPFIPGS